MTSETRLAMAVLIAVRAALVFCRPEFHDEHSASVCFGDALGVPTDVTLIQGKC
jgi:hypothetical protein